MKTTHHCLTAPQANVHLDQLLKIWGKMETRKVVIFVFKYHTRGFNIFSLGNNSLNTKIGKNKQLFLKNNNRSETLYKSLNSLLNKLVNVHSRYKVCFKWKLLEKLFFTYFFCFCVSSTTLNVLYLTAQIYHSKNILNFK